MFFFQAEDGIGDLVRSRGLGDVYKRQESAGIVSLDGESNRVVQELSQLEASRNSLTIEIESLDKKLASLESELPRQELSIISTVGQASDPYIQMLSEQVARPEGPRLSLIHI